MELIETTLKIPASMVPWVRDTEDYSTLDRNAMMLYPLIRRGVFSHGKAASLLGVSKREFLELYARLGIPYLDIPMDEVQNELATFQNLKKH